MSIGLSIADWKYDKDWVYSITYDEALADLSRFVIPIHEELGIPGHVEVVAGQIGEVRDCGASSFNGMRHMNAEELRALVEAGWGVGCHSWSHGMVMEDPDLELRRARETIEQAVGRPVTVYCSPGSNENLTPDVLAKLPECAYLAGMSITDDINRPAGLCFGAPSAPTHSDPRVILSAAKNLGPEKEILRCAQNDGMDAQNDGIGAQNDGMGAQNDVWINRVPIHERYWGVFDSAFDAYKRIRQAQVERGWIVDYCHCPLEEPIHPYKDCTAAHHRERLAAVVAEGGGSCWFANPDDVVDYRYLRRHTRIEADGEGRFVVRVESLPERVRCREVSLLVTGAGTRESAVVTVDGAEVECDPTRPGALWFTVPVSDGMRISVERRKA